MWGAFGDLDGHLLRLFTKENIEQILHTYTSLCTSQVTKVTLRVCEIIQSTRCAGDGKTSSQV